MSKIINIRWQELGMSVRARLLDELNPYACRLLREMLPVVSIQSHAVVAGAQMYAPIRFSPERSKCNFEDMASQPVGRVNIELDFQYFSINYGPMTEAVPAMAVAQVVEEDIPALIDAGNRVWGNLLYGKEYIHVHLEGGEAVE